MASIQLRRGRVVVVLGLMFCHICSPNGHILQTTTQDCCVPPLPIKALRIPIVHAVVVPSSDSSVTGAFYQVEQIRMGFAARILVASHTRSRHFGNFAGHMLPWRVVDKECRPVRTCWPQTSKRLHGQDRCPWNALIPTFS